MSGPEYRNRQKGGFMDDINQKVADALNESQTETVADTVAPEKIKVGEKEYTQDELSQLVGLGEIGRELETKWNTKIDKVYPDYTRSQQEKKDYETKLKEAQDKISELQAKNGTGDAFTDEDIQKAKEAARKVGILTNDDFRQFYAQERAAERLLEDVKSHESKIDGSDGRPAFKAQEILEYMKDTGLTNPELAYKTKYEKEIDAWKEEQLGKVKRTGMTTLETTSAGAKNPPKANINKDNLGEAIREALGQ